MFGGRANAPGALDTADQDRTYGYTAVNDTVAIANACSDQEAKAALRLFHQTWGHATSTQMAKLFDQGVQFGADVSREQILTTQWYCAACARSKFDRKAYSKKSKRKPPPDGIKCGEWLIMDVIQRAETSIEYIDGTGKKRGGGRFALYTMCEVSGASFSIPIKRKSDVEQAVKDTIAHIEIEMRKSCDFNGEPNPKVKRITSDRDSNLTSMASVVHLLEQRVEQRLTATHAANDTPRLDAKIRRLLTDCTAALHACGLPLAYWEHALRYTIAVHNRMPTIANALGRSPDHRWTGVAPDMSVRKWHAFGADASVHLRVEQREHGDKMSPRSKGGDGTLRYLGPDQLNCRGTSSRGAIIFDTTKKRISIERNYKIDPDLTPLRTSPDRATSSPPPATGGVDHGGVDSGGVESESADLDTDSIDANDEWRTLYTTAAPNETYRSVARRFRVDVEALLDHNLRNGKPPRPMDRMLKGTGVWLPDDRDLLALAPSKPAKTTDNTMDLSGRIFKRYVTGFGAHYGAVVEGRDGKGRYRVIYDDLDGIEKPIHLHRRELVDGLLPQGTGHIHVAEAIRAYAEMIRKRGEALEKAEANYVAHAAHVATEIKRGALPNTNYNAAFSALLGSEADPTYWSIAEETFDSVMIPKLLEVHELAAGLVATVYASASDCMKSWPLNERHAQAIFTEASEKWREETLRLLPPRTAPPDSANLVDGLETMRAADMPSVKSYAQAMGSAFAKHWQDAIASEIANLKKHGTFEWVPPPVNRRVHLDGTWAFKAKAHSNGLISRLKARLVARGFKQIYGHDYTKSMAPVGKLVTFRWLLAEMARRGHVMTVMDIESAYLQATLKIPQLMKAPKGVKPPKEGWVMKLIKSLYGLKNAGREWHELFSRDLKEWGFENGHADPCLYTKTDPKTKEVLRVLLFVDDLACFANPNSALLQSFKRQIEAKYNYSSNDANVYLGMTVTKVDAHTYHLGQQRYIEDVLQKYGMIDCHSTHVPFTGDPVSKLDCPDLEPGKNPLQKKYVELIGILRWIERCTRPDLTVALSELGKVQANPGQVHWKKLQHLLRYLSTTRKGGLLYGAPITDKASGPLVGYVDSNWGGVGGGYKSRGGYIFEAWQTPIAWSSFKGTATALSSCEAEYMACSMATQEATWLRYLASDMGYGDLRIQSFGNVCEKDYIKAHLSDRVHSGEQPFTLFNDNKSAIALANDPVFHKRSRHIHIRYHFVRDHVQKGHVSMAYISTHENLSDIMTKCLPRKTHTYLCNKMIYHLNGGAVFKHDGTAVEGSSPTPVVDRLTAPNLQKYTNPYIMDLSDFDSETLMRKACGLSIPARLAKLVGQTLSSPKSARTPVVSAKLLRGKIGNIMRPVAPRLMALPPAA